MAAVQVNSSAIKSLEYNGSAVTVEFAKGSTTTVECTKEQYEAFLKAPSKGQFWNENFRRK